MNKLTKEDRIMNRTLIIDCKYKRSNEARYFTHYFSIKTPSLEFNVIKDVVKKYFESWNKKGHVIIEYIDTAYRTKKLSETQKSFFKNKKYTFNN